MLYRESSVIVQLDLTEVSECSYKQVQIVRNFYHILSSYDICTVQVDFYPVKAGTQLTAGHLEITCKTVTKTNVIETYLLTVKYQKVL